MPKAYGDGNKTSIDEIKPIYAPPQSVCTETYIVIGVFDTKDEAYNLISYIETKFFRFLVSLKKLTQDATKKVYKFVPLQSFKESWNDTKLYAKYNLTKQEISYIESKIRGM